MSKKYNIIKTDNRHIASQLFSHYIQVSTMTGAVDRVCFFAEATHWCIQTWGPSMERDHYRMLSLAGRHHQSPPPWSWHSKESMVLRLYFKDEQTLDWFRLKWE